MTIHASCDCGYTMKVKDSAAGKRIRCSECSGPIDVPLDDFSNEEDAFEDDYYEDTPRRQSSPGSRRSGSSGRSSGEGTRKTTRTRGGQSSRRKKSSGGGSGLGVGLAAGGGAIVVITGIVFGIMHFVGGNDDPQSNLNNVAQQNNVPNPAMPNAGANSTPQNMGQPNAGQPSVVNPANNLPNAVPNNVPVANAAPAGPQLWATLSNFKSVDSGPGAFNKSFTVDYRLISGNVAPGQNIVLYLSEGSSSVIEHYTEVPVEIKPNGSVTFQVGGTFGIRGNIQANLAIKEGYQKWKPISAQISVGGGETSAQAPLTVAQQAGADAQGKTVALANARTESQFGREAYVVKFVVQQQIAGGYYFCVVKDSSGEGFEFDVTTNLRLVQVGVEGEFGGQPIGIARLSGQITAHIEQRSSPIRSGIRFGNEPAPTIVSNTVTFK